MAGKNLIEPDWSKPSYLKKGSRKQQAAAAALDTLAIFQQLAQFEPVLVGTIPLGIDLENSDLDILCSTVETGNGAFLQRCQQLFGGYPGFQVRQKSILNVPTALVRFNFQGFPFELFGQPVPAFQQRGFRHMVVEWRLLQLAGSSAAEEIRQLKQGGMKTEPAFAAYFKIIGDPYHRLDEMADYTIADLQREMKADNPGEQEA
jgi:hypothetical protein